MNKYVHLTNYSVNKKSEQFVQNKTHKIDNYGHKWSLGAWMRSMRQNHVDMDTLWSKIYDLIIKTIISAEEGVLTTMRQFNVGRNNCFDLLGFDVIIDDNLVPHLLEVNLSPSLNTESDLDLYIKQHLLVDTFNLLSLKPEPEDPPTRVAGIRAQRDPQLEQKILRDTLQEFTRRGSFYRIFPAQGTYVYHDYMTGKWNKRIHNLLFK